MDDDDALRDQIADYLSNYGFTVHQARSAEEMRKRLATEPIQLIILDLVLPGEDGLSVCKSFFGKGPPILVLSAMSEPGDRILGLELGADDYLSKPVVPRELVARVRALLRRRERDEPDSRRIFYYSFAGFRLDVIRGRLKTPNGEMLLLRPAELFLLNVFLENLGRPLPLDSLYNAFRSSKLTPSADAVDVLVNQLRQKVNDRARDEIIRSLADGGYLFDAKVTMT